MTIKFYLYSRVLSNGKKMLKVRVAHKQNNVLKDTNLSTGISIVPKFWDKDNERVVDMHPSQATINERISEIKQRKEDLLNKFDAKKLTYHQVVSQIMEKETDESIDDFIETKIKDRKSDASYTTYQNHLKGFKKLIGHRGKLGFSDINNETFILAHSNGVKRQKEGTLASKSFRGYITSILTLITEAKFYGLTELTLDIPMQYKNLNKIKDESYHITKNKGNTTEQVYKAIEECNSIQQWQSIALWVFAFSMRGFYYGDIASLKQKDIKDAEDNEIGHLLSTFLKDDIHVYHRRSKSAFPMYIKIFKYPVLNLLKRIKMSVVYTHNDRRLHGKSILGSINDQLSIFDYDYKNNIKWHNQMTKHFQKKLRKYGLTFKKARKTFNQVGQDLQMSETERLILIGHKEGGQTIKNAYDNNTLPQLLKRVDELHLEILEKFRVEDLYDRLLVKLKAIIMKQDLPKWILGQSAVHREGRRLKVLTGIHKKGEDYQTYNERLEWTEITDEKYRKYFLQDRRMDEDYWSDIHTINNPDSTLKRVYDKLTQSRKEVEKAETKVFKLKVS